MPRALAETRNADLARMKIRRLRRVRVYRSPGSARAAESGGESLAGVVTGFRDQEFRAGAGACRGRARSG